MAEVIGNKLIFLGLAYKVFIRAPYTHQKQIFSILRCSFIYLRLVFLTISFNTLLTTSTLENQYTSYLFSFLFPLHSLLSLLDKSVQISFFYYILIQLIIILVLGLSRYIYKGEIKLKIAIYLIELLSPDVFLYLVYNFLNLSSFNLYSQSLGF